MKCENCGKEIDHIITSYFDPFDIDHTHKIPIVECENNAVYFDTDESWVGDELSEEEQHECILCPHCEKPPFKSYETQIYRIIRVVKFKNM